MTARKTNCLNPDICTSISCDPPQEHCRECSHAIYKGSCRIDGRRYIWEHSPMFGPLFSRAGKTECGWTPHPRHPVWKAFERWHDWRFGERGKAQ